MHPKTKPFVALVGRPNVGKSTLFNRLAGERLAVVDEVPGTTREPLHADAEWNGRVFTVIDTGGIEVVPARARRSDRALDEHATFEQANKEFIPLIRAQAEVAIEEADAVVLVVDSESGLTSADREEAGVLRRDQSERNGEPWPPIFIAANKADNAARRQNAVEFYELGVGEVYAISALHGRGLSKKASEAVDVLDAAGKQVVIIETVGVGQSELDIAAATDTTVVVLVPESGDSIQAMKAGLMEIADVFVLNKADRAGAYQAAMAIQMILNFRKFNGWVPHVLKTVASEGSGITELAGTIGLHRPHIEQSGGLESKRRARLERRIAELVTDKLRVDFWTSERKAFLSTNVTGMAATGATPYDIAKALLDDFHRGATRVRQAG